MKIEERGGSRERTILTAMVTDRIVLAKVVQIWEEKGMFTSVWANLVGGWCVAYFKEYDLAPGKKIESCYEAWAEAVTDKDSKKLVEVFLEGLSEEYDREEAAASGVVIDMAGKLFNRVKLTKAVEAIQGELSLGRTEKAMERLSTFLPINVGKGASIEVLYDEEAIRAAFEESQEPLFTYPGAAGRFFGSSLERDGFLAFMAPEKGGKCVDENMNVILSDGRVRTIRQIVENSETERPMVLSLDEKTGKFEPRPVAQFWDNGEKMCYKIVTKTGRSVSTTMNHKFLTPTGWKELEEVREGEFIAVPKKLEVFGSTPMDPNVLKFLAYMLADGGCTAGSPNFTKTDPVLIEDFQLCCKELGFPVRKSGIHFHLKKAIPLTKQLGMYGHKSTTKRIPDVLFSAPREQIAEFLRIFFTCDGGIYTEKNGLKRIQLTLANEGMLRQFAHLLLRFGIVHTFRYHKATCNGKFFDSWRITISSHEYVQLFLKEINFLSYKQTASEKTTSHKSFLDVLPWEIVKEVWEKIKAEGRGSLRKAFGQKRVGMIREQLRLRQPMMRQNFIKSHHPLVVLMLSSDVLWDRITSITTAGTVKTYDLGVDQLHNFVANDCVVHNSFFLLDVAWRAMCSRKKVAFFSVGDMSQNQMMRRFMIRAACRPLKAGTVRRPVEIKLKEEGATVTYEERVFPKSLSWQAAHKACVEVMASKVKSKESLLRLTTHPNSSVTAMDIHAQLTTWAREDYVPDVCVIDYADILANPSGSDDARDGINRNWQALRRISQDFHCLVVTATQTNAASYDADLIEMRHFSGDKRKFAHTTGVIGINRNSKDRRRGVARLNWLVGREFEYSSGRCLHAATCLAIANPCVKSAY